MKMLGAEVRPVAAGARTLKDAMNEALRDWVTNVADTFYCIGTAAGPHPYPEMVRDFQCVIGDETRAQMHGAGGPPARQPRRLRSAAARTPSASSIPSSTTRASRFSASRPPATGSTSRTATPPRSPAGGPACCTATAPISCMTDDGQIIEGHSISAGLDYPGVGPEHAWLQDVGRVTYLSATDEEALEAFQLCSTLEGIIPALEPAHALAKVIELAPKRPKDHLMVMNMCGRGDKDIFAVAEHLGGI